MRPAPLTRRIAVLGGLATLGGCSAITALDSAADPLDTYDLLPKPGSTSGRRSTRTMLIARPDTPASLASDRIMIKPDAASITYLPDARWSDEVPLVVQSLLIRSISSTGRIGYVGRSEGGPVPDRAVLGRINAFNVNVLSAGGLTVAVDFTLTVLNDSDQRVIATRDFSSTGLLADDAPRAVVGAFQAALDELLPEMADWSLRYA